MPVMDDLKLIIGTVKWVAIVFAAGFVGYFGKYLSIRLIARLRGDGKHKDGTALGSVETPGQARDERTGPPESPAHGHSPHAQPEGAGAQEQKLEKKRGKDLLKLHKKAAKAAAKENKESSGSS